jgi:hypothetical protein
MGTTNSESQTSTSYDTYGLPTLVQEYGYGSGAVGSLVRKTYYRYAQFNNPTGTISFERPSAEIVCEPTRTASDCGGSGTVAAKTSYSYSNTVTTTSGTPEHNASVSGDRANLVTTTYLINAGTGSSMNRQFSFYDTSLVNGLCARICEDA